MSGAKSEIPSPIVLDPGRYTISVKTDKFLFLDYFVLLPAAYYEASILTKKLENPCELGDLESCRHYRYPSIDEFPTIDEADDDSSVEKYTDDEHLLLLRSKPLPLISETQQSLRYTVNVRTPGKYIIVVDYITDRQNPESYEPKVRLTDSSHPDGKKKSIMRFEVNSLIFDMFF